MPSSQASVRKNRGAQKRRPLRPPGEGRGLAGIPRGPSGVCMAQTASGAFRRRSGSHGNPKGPRWGLHGPAASGASRRRTGSGRNPEGRRWGLQGPAASGGGCLCRHQMESMQRNKADGPGEAGAGHRATQSGEPIEGFSCRESGSKEPGLEHPPGPHTLPAAKGACRRRGWKRQSRNRRVCSRLGPGPLTLPVSGTGQCCAGPWASCGVTESPANRPARRETKDLNQNQTRAPLLTTPAQGERRDVKGKALAAAGSASSRRHTEATQGPSLWARGEGEPWLPESLKMLCVQMNTMQQLTRETNSLHSLIFKR